MSSKDKKDKDKDKDKKDKDKKDKDKKDKDKDKDKDKKDKDKDKDKDKKKKDKKSKSKDEKKAKAEKQAKMTKEQKKKEKEDKKKKKIEKKETLIKADVYEPATFAAYQSKVSDAQTQAKAGRRGEAAQQALVELANCGKAEGLQIWRIEEFSIVPVPKQMYGKFYDGDSYVVLRTARISNAWQWDVHFWIGENSTQDEYGAAAVWTVQIDDKLGGKATQHREVQDFESQQFLSYFNPGIQLLKGGIESAFRHVDRDEHRDRLLKVKGAKNVRITEVACYPNSLNSGDVFVLDTKDFIYEWIGKQSSIHERRKAGELCTAIRNERGAKPTIITIEESRGDDDPRFWEGLGGKGPVMTAEEGGDDFTAEAEKRTEKKLFKLSDASGRLQFTQVASGKVNLNQFQTNDVFVFDSGFEIFLWIGKGASAGERAASLGQAQQYLQNSGKPAFLPITKIQQTTSYPETFTAALD